MTVLVHWGVDFCNHVCAAPKGASTLRNAMSRSVDLGLTVVEAAAEVQRVIEVVNGWRAHFEALGVCQGDLKSLAERVEGDAGRA